MGPLGIKPPRLRVALIAVLAALAAMAIAGPGVASAAPNQNLSLSCLPGEVEAGKKMNCLAIVSSKGGAPAPTGKVFFFVTGFTGFIDLGPDRCDLKPISGTSSFCSLAIRGLVGGEENIIAQYFDFSIPPPNEEPAADNVEITIHGGSMRVFCQDPVLVNPEPTECQAFIPSGHDGAPATGRVAFSSANRLSAAAPGEVEPECMLEPVSEGASCSVTFSPFAGEHAVLGEYEGDGTYPADNGTGFSAAAEKHLTEVEASCDQANPVAFAPLTCRLEVTSVWPPTGAPPIGDVEFDNEGAGTFPGPAFGNCALAPVDMLARKSACSVVYKPGALGPQTLEGHYKGHEKYVFGRDFVDIDVRKGLLTATKLDCEVGKVGVSRKCVATVRDAEGNPATSPNGTVSFTGSLFSSKTCQLAPLQGGFSRCEVSYKPTVSGSLILRAEYSGSASTHSPSKTETSVPVLP